MHRPQLADDIVMSCPEARRAEVHVQQVERIFREHNEALLRFLRIRLPPEEAKEVAQESYVRILGMPDPGNVHFLLGYLYRTAGNLAKNRIKQRAQRRRDDGLVFFETEDGRSPERLCQERAEVAVIRQALAELPANCREAFRLVRIEGLSSDEAARQLDMHPRRVRRYVARALAYCLECMDGARSQGALRCAGVEP